MRKAILLGIVAVLFAMVAAPVRADIDDKDVAEVIQRRNQGFPIWTKFGNYAKYQVVSFNVTGIGVYSIDLKAQLCFCGTVVVPCKNLKKGYPELAPIITWDD